MSADFNAGSIEGTLDLDTSPFRRGLDWAKAEAKKFEDKDIRPELHLDTKAFTADKDKAKAELDKLGATDAKPEVKLRGVPGVVGGLKLVQHEMDKTNRTAMVGMIAKFGLLAGGALALLAALGPLSAAVIAFGVAGGAAMGGLVIAFGLFAGSVKSALGPILKANKAGVDLAGWAGKVQDSLKGLTSGWSDLQKTIRPDMLKFLSATFGGLAAILPKLTPLLKVMASGMTQVVNAVFAVTKSPLFDKFLKQLQAFMGGFLHGLGPVLANSLKTFFNLFSALQPLMSMMGRGIEKAADAAQKFTAGPGMTKFIDDVQKFLPLIGKLVGDLTGGLGHLGAGLAPLAGPALKFIDALVKAVGNLNLAPVAKGFGDLLDALTPLLPVLSDLVNKGLALIGPALSAVGNALKFIEKHQAAVAVLVGLGTVVGIIKAIAIATSIWNKALLLLNIVLTANPIGIVIVLLAGLAAGLIYAYKHSDTFRKIVNEAFQKVKDVVSNVIGWFKNSLIPFFTTTIPNAFRDTLDWVSSHWHKLEDWLVSPVKSAWSELKTMLSNIKNGFHDAVDAVGHFFAGLPGKLEAPVRSALNWLSDHFAKPINDLLGKVGLSIRIPTFGYSEGGPVTQSHRFDRIDKGYAEGGLLTGTWKGPKADNILIRANPREFVEPVAAVDHYGPELFEALRQRRIPKEAIPRFGLGGLVGDAWGGVKHAASSVISSVNPAHVFSSLANKLLSGFGHDIFGQSVGAIAKKTVGALSEKVKGFIGDMFGGGGKGGAPGPYHGTSGVGQWAGLASHVLAMLGQSQAWLGTLLHRMSVESGGNPRAINLWDSNAAAGHPSKGLMQTIDGTFNAYAGPYRGLGIWNPLANIYAGVNYALHRYGVPAVGGTQGYANGGVTSGPLHAIIGDNPGGHEAVVPLDKYDLPKRGEVAAIAARSAQTNTQIVALLGLIAKAIASGSDYSGLAEALGHELSKHSETTMRQMVQIARAA